MPDVDAPTGTGSSGTPVLADGGGDRPAADPIVALRVIDDAIELPLPWSSEKQSLTLGSAKHPKVDVRIQARHVSKTHAKLHLRGHQVAVVDENSRNGTYFRNLRERETEFLIRAGDIFYLADKRVLALNGALRSLRPRLPFWLGYRADESVDLALASLAPGDPLLLLGAQGSELDRLARLIHDNSSRRAGPFIEAAKSRRTALDDAWGGTIFVDLQATQQVTGPFVAGLFAPSAHVRPIFASTTVAKAETALGKERARCLPRIVAPPLGHRGHDVPLLLNEVFSFEMNSGRTVSELGDASVAALVAHRWRDQLAGLRRAAPKVHALIVGGNPNAAAKILGISHQAVRETLKTLGLSVDGAPKRR